MIHPGGEPTSQSSAFGNQKLVQLSENEEFELLWHQTSCEFSIVSSSSIQEGEEEQKKKSFCG
jgi:hypothetical protein